MLVAPRALALAALLASAAVAAPAAADPRGSSAAGSPARAARAEVTLFGFGGSDGAYPSGALIADGSGALYGTTAGGGRASSGCGFYATCGTAFRLTPGASGYTETVLHAFRGGSDGNVPIGGLVADKSGVLFGATRFGGSTACGQQLGCGTVFELRPNGRGYAHRVLYRFGGGTDGFLPSGGMIVDASGALYGMTTWGGVSGYGTAFKLTPSGSGYAESVIYSFTLDNGDGGMPQAALVADAHGVLYGTTSGGGNGWGSECLAEGGCGTAFTLTPSGSGYTEAVIHSFHDANDLSDGIFPSAGLAWGPGGTLVGTTAVGGSGAAAGTVYTLTPVGSGSYAESVAYSFQGGTDGSDPNASVIVGARGVVFGSTAYGGGASGGSGYGVVFALTPRGSTYGERLVYRFAGGQLGAEPNAVLRAHGTLYGTTANGGPSGAGMVFKLGP